MTTVLLFAQEKNLVAFLRVLKDATFNHIVLPLDWCTLIGLGQSRYCALISGTLLCLF